jgi:hypothetical protein
MTNIRLYAWLNVQLDSILIQKFVKAVLETVRAVMGHQNINV